MAARRLFSVQLTPPGAQTINAFVLASSAEAASEKVIKVTGIEKASVEVTDCKDRDVVLIHVEANASKDADGEEEVSIDLRFDTRKA